MPLKTGAEIEAELEEMAANGKLVVQAENRRATLATLETTVPVSPVSGLSALPPLQGNNPSR